MKTLLGINRTVVGARWSKTYLCFTFLNLILNVERKTLCSTDTFIITLINILLDLGNKNTFS